MAMSGAERSRLLYAKYPERRKAANKKWIENNRAKYRDYKRRRRLRKYGMTPESYAEMWEAQGFRCAICRADKSGDPKGWHLDHCHKSNTARGILCCHCNRMLGGALDRVEALMGGISYLLRSAGAIAFRSPS